MDRRIRFYSDDSYSSCGNRRSHVVVAGLSIEANRADVTRALLEAEAISGKGLRDWRSTHPTRVRERYWDAVMNAPSLQGRIFFAAFDALGTDQYWDARVDALTLAIREFSTGKCHHLMAHEGLKAEPRHQLRQCLIDRGCERVQVPVANFIADPEVRLSDAVAGYVRGELYRGDGQRAVLTNIPDDFVELGLKNEAPRISPGGERPRPVCIPRSL